MKKLCLTSLTGIFVFIAGAIFAQDSIPPDKRTVWISAQSGFEVVSGNVNILSSEKIINISVVTKIRKMGAKYQTDSAYIADRVKEFNAKKPGEGDAWLMGWNKEKNNFNPAFIEGFDKIMSKYGIRAASDDASAEYTLIIYTLHMMEFMGKIYVILDGDIVKTKDPQIKLVSLRFPVLNGAKKGQLYYEKYERAYYSAGWLFGKYFKKKIMN